jgi:hypothetical protein
MEMVVQLLLLLVSIFVCIAPDSIPGRCLCSMGGQTFGIPHFIEGFNESKVNSIQDIVAFNEKYKDLALPERKSFLFRTEYTF